jgi:small multidrug resistance family-3 protein
VRNDDGGLLAIRDKARRLAPILALIVPVPSHRHPRPPCHSADTEMSARVIIGSVLLFLLAGLLEIGGGYLVWLWLRESRGWILGVVGGLILFLYAVVPTLQPAHFGRVYAAYGGVFVVLSLLWGWSVGGVRPDRPEVVGALLCLIGVGVIMYWPRP